MNIEIDDTLKLEQFLLLCLHTDTNPVRNTKCGKSSKNSWNHLHCCLPDKLESMVLEFLSMERAKYVPIWNCFFCFKVALRLWFCRSIDHIFVLNQSRVLLVCLTLFLCEAKWHLLLDLLFVFCTKKSWQKKTGVWSQNVSLPKSRQAQKSYNYPHNPPHGAPAKKRPEKWRRGQRRQQQPQW